MNNNELKIHAVVVTFNSEQWIDACLNSLLESTVQPIIWVIDNASGDQTCNIIRQSFPSVRLLQNKKNIGFGQANNIGIMAALSEKADYILLLNQDAKLQTNCLEKLLDAARVQPQYGILSPLHLSYSGEETDNHCNAYLYGGAPRFLSDLVLGKVQGLYEIAFMPAAIWLLRVTSLKVAGIFDPLFHMYGEDFDLCERTKRLGFKVGLVPGAMACHWHGGPDSRQQTVGALARDQYWQYVVWLKEPSQAMFKTCINIFREFLVRFFNKAVYLDYRSCLGLLLGLVKTAAKLPEIAHNRKLCTLPAAFLPAEEDMKKYTNNNFKLK